MKKSELNNIAKREVVKTSRFAKLIKKGSCKVEQKSEGDTLHTVNSMAAAVLHYQHQTKELAKALLGKSLQETVINNYKFLYSHFQYEADGFLQQLRSPQCSFSDRFSGIDCKSYSLFASTLLLNQNILHYIRRIKQPQFNPEHWSHVYIVVPKDQVNGDLDQGYYVIDGTLHINKETPYKDEPHDTKMGKGMQHVWLNGAAQAPQNSNKTILEYQFIINTLLKKGVHPSLVDGFRSSLNSYLKQGILPELEILPNGFLLQGEVIDLTNRGLNGSSVEPDGDYGGGDSSGGGSGGFLSNLNFSDIDFSSIGSLFGSLDCIGGSAYTKDLTEKDRNAILARFKEIITRINVAASKKDYTNLSKAVTDFKGYGVLIDEVFNIKKNEGWNSCTSKNLQNNINLAIKFRYGGATALNAWLDKFYSKTLNGSKSFSSTLIDSFWGGWIRPVHTSKVNHFNYTHNNIEQAIPQFEFNDYAASTGSNAFNAGTFLSTLGNIILPIVNGNQVPTNPNTGSNQNGGGVINPGGTPQAQKAGFNPMIAIGLLTLAGGAYAYNESQKSKTNTTKPTPKKKK